MGGFSFNTVIAEGTWAEGGTWQMVPYEELPHELAADPKFCTHVGVVAFYDPPGSTGLPRVVMNHRDVGRNGKPPLEEIASGKVDPLDPEDPDGPREEFEETGRRESREESGIKLGRLVALACRISDNPEGSPYAGLSYMLYYFGFVEGRVGVPEEVGHTNSIMTPEDIGYLARLSASEAPAKEGTYKIAVSEARLIRAAYIAAGYSKTEVYRAMGPFEV